MKPCENRDLPLSALRAQPPLFQHLGGCRAEIAWKWQGVGVGQGWQASWVRRPI